MSVTMTAINNSFYNEDCLDMMERIPSGSIDFILCDLPYGTTKCKWDIIIPFEYLWAAYKRIIKENGAIALFGTEPFSSRLRLSNLEMYRYDWYWEKDKGANFLFGNRMPLKTIETISIFYKKQPTYNPQKTINPKGSSKRHLGYNPARITKNMKDVMGETWKEDTINTVENYGGSNYEPDKLLPKQLVYFAKDQRGKIHPTQKPVQLLEYLVNTYTNADETVLDNCAGSGSTGVACLQTGRNFILVEKDKTYYEAAEQRLNNTKKEIRVS